MSDDSIFGSYAVVRDQINPRGVSVALGRRNSYYDFNHGGWVTDPNPDVEAPSSAWLRIMPDDARALYEALAEHFGHSGHDTRALRKDYDAERGRVDKLINHVIGAVR